MCWFSLFSSHCDVMRIFIWRNFIWLDSHFSYVIIMRIFVFFFSLWLICVDSYELYQSNNNTKWTLWVICNKKGSISLTIHFYLRCLKQSCMSKPVTNQSNFLLNSLNKHNKIMSFYKSTIWKISMDCELLILEKYYKITWHCNYRYTSTIKKRSY